MPKSTLVRLHAAGASHRELRLFFRAGEFPQRPARFEPSPSEVFRVLAAANVPSERASEISRAFASDEAASAFGKVESVWARLVLETDPEYPQAFLGMPRRPFILYVRGRFPDSPVSVSVVWSRKASAYGKEVTARFVRDFVGRGMAVVSGGAAGIDSAAHVSALDAGGRTVAFVWTGIDVDYPRSNSRLFDSIAESWAVVSVFAPWEWPLPHHFPIRNALVACYSDGTLVTEAALKSGSLITAKLALDFWKEVFAVPWDVVRPGSLWANSLIRDGSAKCVSFPEDVVCEFLPRLAPSDLRMGSDTAPGVFSTSTAKALASLGPADSETLSVETGLPLERVLSELSELEISWYAFSDLFGNYSLRIPVS